MFETRDSVVDIWGARTPHNGHWPVRLDAHLDKEPDQWVQSACVLCSNGCGMDIGVKDGRIVGVRGRVEDRVNKGRLGPKGLNGWVANHSPDRLTHPLIRRNGKLEQASWEEAMQLLVQRSQEIIDRDTGAGIGIYNTGQLFLEEYYTLAIIAKAGIGTNHTDGNTRLCTATAAEALMESFGVDGQPGSYSDIDITDAIFLYGHNMAATQTVLWARVLDRLASPNRPKIVVIDPRKTPTAAIADIHLTPRLGTNVALLNGLINQLIESGWIDRAYIEAHTVGFDKLEEISAKWPAQRVEAVTGVPEKQLKDAAYILGNSPTFLSTLLQGMYQSNQATAASCQVNNIHLLRGMIGKPGGGILQMNGQPTSQNTRECGANGELPGFRNWANPAHIEELARIWNVPKSKIPSFGPPTHAMQMWRYAETGSIKMLWIICTNPAVSMPEVARIRRILEKEDLFVVVQDIFLTETAQRADLVLPAAMWGEKTGTFTNTDRTVHISYKAIEPPGEARPDLDIFLEYALRMGFKDRDGAPLVKWHDPEGAFEAWKVCSKGRPCDYSGITYQKLTGGSGIQWPCNDQYPEGKERLYEDGVFGTFPEYVEVYGHDLETGAERTEEEFKLHNPQGKAVIKASDYIPPQEHPDPEYPFWYTTGRVTHHFHTRTKTARSARLNAAAPEAYVQISEVDARARGINEGDMVEVTSRRGSIQVPARIGDIEQGHLFVPFHYGYFDHTDEKQHTAANELTQTTWDPVSKQPHFKYAAVKISKI